MEEITEIKIIYKIDNEEFTILVKEEQIEEKVVTLVNEHIGGRPDDR